MKRQSSLSQTFLLFLAFIFITPCSAQNKWPVIKKNHFITQYPDEFFFVQCGLQDKKGNMWFGTAGDGINYYPSTSPSTSEKLFTNFTRNDGLCHNDILCCFEDKAGIIWFGTRGGLIRYKPSGDQPNKNDFKCFSININTISNTDKKKIQYSYTGADNFVWSIMQDKSGKIWFGTGKGVYVHDPLENIENDAPLFTHFLYKDSVINKNKLHLMDVTSIAQDKDGNIWFASSYQKGEGICCYDGKSIVNFKPDNISSFRTIIKSKSGNLFFLNVFQGVYLYDAKLNSEEGAEKIFTNFTKKIGINDTIVAVMEDKAGNMWFGATSDNMWNGGIGGAWRYDPLASDKDEKPLKLFTTKDGLSHNCVFLIVEEKNGSIWFGTRKTGLCRFDGKTFTDFTDR